MNIWGDVYIGWPLIRVSEMPLYRKVTRFLSTHNFLLIFCQYGFFTKRSNCLLLPDLLWCPIQELGLFFSVDWYSANTHNRRYTPTFTSLLAATSSLICTLAGLDDKWKCLSINAPPATRIVKFLRPKVLCHDGLTHTDQLISFYYLDSLLYMHKITFHDYTHMRTNIAHVQISRMHMRNIHAALSLPGTVIVPQTPKLNCQKSRFFGLVTLTFDLQSQPS